MILNTAINCWHISDHESVAMWKLYAAGAPGIAVRSTVERFASSLPLWKGRPEVSNQPWKRTLFIKIEALAQIELKYWRHSLAPQECEAGGFPWAAYS